jgi:hypothetical protein
MFRLFFDFRLFHFKLSYVSLRAKTSYVNQMGNRPNAERVVVWSFENCLERLSVRKTSIGCLTTTTTTTNDVTLTIQPLHRLTGHVRILIYYTTPHHTTPHHTVPAPIPLHTFTIDSGAHPLHSLHSMR